MDDLSNTDFEVGRQKCEFRASPSRAAVQGVAIHVLWSLSRIVGASLVGARNQRTGKGGHKARPYTLESGLNSIRLVLALVLWLAFHSVAFAELPALVKEKKCDTCHRFFRDSPKPANEGPHLFFAGDKFQKSWLTAYLQKPDVIRKAGHVNDPGFLQGQPVLGNPHVALSPEEAGVVADYLLTLKIPGPAVAVDKEALSGGNKARIKSLFERDYGCSACHETINLAGKIHGGISGPSLVDAGNRLNAEWVLRQLKTPKEFLEKGRMPVFQLEDDVLVQLTRYIMTMKKENLK